ncbi:MAG: hypothetical protein Q9178_004729 [Gyalolechia marmorata]
MRDIWVDSIDELTAEDLVGGGFIQFKGQDRDITSEELQRLQHLAATPSSNRLARTPLSEDGEPTANATSRRVLEEVWGNGVRTFEYISLESTPPLSEYDTGSGNEIQEAYNTLVEMGGRPTREIRLDPGLPDPIEAQRGLLYYHSFWEAQLTFKDELYRWQKFRHHQRKARERPKEFPAYCQSVHDYRLANGMEGEIYLHLQWDKQTKLDEWKEYQFFQHRELAGPRARVIKRIERAQRQLDTGRSANGSAEYQIRSANLDLEVLDDLWYWVEQQLSQIASDPAISGSQDKSDDRLGMPRKTRLMHEKGTRSRHLAGVLFYDYRHDRHECQIFDCQAFEKAIVDPSVSELKSKRKSKVRGTIPAPLGPIHSSRVSKSNGKQPNGMYMNSTKLPSPLAETRPGKNKNALPAPMQTSKISQPTAALRRSARIAKRESRLEGAGVPPESTRTIGAQKLGFARTGQSSSEPKQLKTSPLREAVRKKTRQYPPSSSKSQGIKKRRGFGCLRKTRIRGNGQ